MFVADMVFLIEQAGLGTWNQTIFEGPNAVIPEDDGPYISIVSSGGASPEGTHNATSAPAYVRPSAQITSRAMDPEIAETLARQLWDLFYPVRNQKVNGTWWREVRMVQSEPFPIAKDEKSRARFVFNIDVVKRLSPATS